jgi:hypothetical protein
VPQGQKILALGHSRACAARGRPHVRVRKTAAWLLPGARYRRHLLWRYSLVWTKPALTRSR